jgi:6-phosphogluconolactonase
MSHVVPSTGSTPRRLYEYLAAPEIASRFPWNRSHWFWGDERFVPHDHRESNFRLANEAFLSRVPVPRDNIHAVPTEGLSAEQAAIGYETTLKRFYGADALAPGRPLFDVTLLGIGEDGHTASLFPGQPALQETRRWVVAVIGAKAEPRITLTFPALASSRDVAFVATGREKRQVVARAQARDPTIPAGVICASPAGERRVPVRSRGGARFGGFQKREVDHQRTPCSGARCPALQRERDNE